eukprot:scaffold50801_cov37-Prasinocladus_malaysianus.AAC.2
MQSSNRLLLWGELSFNILSNKPLRQGPWVALANQSRPQNSCHTVEQQEWFEKVKFLAFYRALTQSSRTECEP